nr:homocysteine-responsive endoplasmic reticulum-resident ubiquitin-like domain member 2 protein isoform X2 [Parasteatoda tepidariorum]
MGVYVKNSPKKMSVQLIIKSAAQNVDDFKLQCEMTWTIAQVKDQISTTHPTKPASSHQKLIYGGKLLPDHLPLKSILNPTQDIHILHLVCPCPVKLEPQKSSTSNEKTASPPLTVPPLNQSDLYPQVNQQLPTPPVFTGVQGGTTNFLALNTPGDVVHQYFAMQQMYTQFMAQYLSQYNGVTPNGQIPMTPPPVQEPAPAVPPQNVNRNAEPRAAGENGWDWIDLIYVMSRATMFFAILIYYSSPPRIIAVFVLMVLLVLFAKVNRERQRDEAQQANERQRPELNTTPEENSEANENAEASEDAPAENQPATPSARTPMQTALSVPYTIFFVIYSFFTSLIPADPVPVNVN